MGGRFLSTRAFLLAAGVALLLLAAGCGGSDSGSGSDEVTVQTGSLSKAEFIAKADAICEAARTEFLAKFSRFFNAHKSELTGEDNESKFLVEVVDSLVDPNVEGQIAQISKLGAPESYASEATSFLNALQRRLNELHEDPAETTATPFPFAKAEKVARKVGMDGCAESFG